MMTGSDALINGPDVVGLLWDLDNVAVPHRLLMALGMSMRDACGPDAVLVAAGRRQVAESARQYVEPLGFTVMSGGQKRNGADWVLVNEHRRLSIQGVTHFAVASCDHDFVAVARRSRTTVFTLDIDRVSVRLLSEAQDVVEFHNVSGLYVPVPQCLLSNNERCGEMRGWLPQRRPCPKGE